MAAVKNVKPVGSDFGNQENLIRVQYDFSQDAGAIGNLDLMLDADGDVLVELVGISVEEAVTSAGAATVAVGIANSDEFRSAIVLTTFTAGAFVQPETVGLVQKVADGANVTMSIATAALTAGKMTFIFKAMSF
jgi:hypothetical protein